MSYEPNTALSLRNNELNLELILDRSSSSPLPLNPSEPRVFSCNYCRRKFYSSQALGGHQNAHKLERTLAKKNRELSSAVRPHSGSNHQPFGPISSLGQHSNIGHDHHHHHHHHHRHHHEFGRFISEMNYGRREMDYDDSRMESHQCWNKGGYKPEVVQEDYTQIDLSLRL